MNKFIKLINLAVVILDSKPRQLLLSLSETGCYCPNAFIVELVILLYYF